ncbi:hypothetical protein J005_02467 [Cryptococcus neoformans]|nr:hypothetical protein C344_02388 [Cryptococcus neoformans var. grubii AD1-7a]OXH34660.1 hypothetical protein J005_02467 [Cryptococcus neoformans var. grubii]
MPSLTHIVPLALAAACGVSASLATMQKREVSYPGVLGFLEPTPRGWDYSTMGTSPCGGFTTINQTYYGLSTGMEFQVSNDVSNIVISYSTSSDMSNAVTLATIESATAGTMCLDGEDLFEGEGFTFGDDITLQVFYHDDVTEQDGYQCADISFTSDHVMTVTCSNTSTIITKNGGSSTSSSGSTTTVTVTAKSGKITPLQAGWIGACVTIAVFGFALLALCYFGAIFFSRNALRRSEIQFGSHRMAGHSLDDISLHRRTTVDHKTPL